MRQSLNNKKIKQLAKKHNLPLVAVWVRGNTNHRKDLICQDGTIYNLEIDGTIKKDFFKAVL